MTLVLSSISLIANPTAPQLGHCLLLILGSSFIEKEEAGCFGGIGGGVGGAKYCSLEGSGGGV